MQLNQAHIIENLLVCVHCFCLFCLIFFFCININLVLIWKLTTWKKFGFFFYYDYYYFGLFCGCGDEVETEGDKESFGGYVFSSLVFASCLAKCNFGVEVFSFCVDEKFMCHRRRVWLCVNGELKHWENRTWWRILHPQCVRAYFICFCVILVLRGIYLFLCFSFVCKCSIFIFCFVLFCFSMSALKHARYIVDYINFVFDAHRIHSTNIYSLLLLFLSISLCTMWECLSLILSVCVCMCVYFA